jgi:NADPH2:quinone reductase
MFVKAFYVDEFGHGRLDKDHEEPTPAANEVIVSVEATSLGYVDLMVYRGEYPLVTKPGFILGSEMAGVVVAAGECVSRHVIGNRIFAMPNTGSFAQLCAVGSESLHFIPDGLTSTEVMALGTNALVAYEVTERTSIGSGDDVLIRGASGGIGLMATQMAAVRGARVTAITSSAQNGERLVALGANRYQMRETARLTADTYDVIIDTVGGEEVDEFIARLASNGRYALCGGVAGPPSANFGSTIIKNFHQSPTFMALSLHSVDPARLRLAMQDVFQSAADGRVAPVISDVVDLGQVAEALRQLEHCGNFGKLVVTM